MRNRDAVRDQSFEDEFVELLTAHQQIICAYLTSLLPGDPGVDDVLQRVNIVLWKKRDKFELGTNFKAWAFSISRWETKAWLSEKKRKNWLVFDDELTNSIEETFHEQPLPDDSPAGDELRHCLSKLKDKERNLIFRYYEDEQSIAECALALQRTPGSLRVTLHRIRAALRRCIESRMSISNFRP